MSARPPCTDGNEEITALLARWSAGDSVSFERLLPLVYGELRSIASKVFRRERSDHTLQPTAVVHEALLKLVGGRPIDFRDRAHFFAVASQAMRQILVDHARGRIAAKRGGGVTRMELREEIGSGASSGLAAIDVLAVNEALDRLAALDREQARVVELRFFGGLSVEESALVLGVSTATVKRTWRLARAFLSRDLAAATAE